ncbi:hypothetical protein Q5P01_006298 [Channa striata]|uniref:Uncharacterized protein n=1 Tax=Channa striata TaxID=64152 RepID=A0AA88SWV9_CHASR|nr:hypothetical protein Q5P01_006298 [Channa striata]
MNVIDLRELKGFPPAHEVTLLLRSREEIKYSVDEESGRWEGVGGRGGGCEEEEVQQENTPMKTQLQLSGGPRRRIAVFAASSGAAGSGGSGATSRGRGHRCPGGDVCCRPLRLDRITATLQTSERINEVPAAAPRAGI